jgi:hypothetical protein
MAAGGAALGHCGRRAADKGRPGKQRKIIIGRCDFDVGLLAQRAGILLRAVFLLPSRARKKMATVLVAGVISSHPRNINPANGKPPNMVFNVAEGDGRVWQITALDETELGVERLQFGDAIAVTGHLNIDVETDRKGHRRVSFKMEARQILFLRGRSIAKAAMVPHEQQPSGLVRPRVG